MRGIGLFLTICSVAIFFTPSFSPADPPAAAQSQPASTPTQGVSTPSAAAEASWPGFRGPAGDNCSPCVPASLPDKATPKWKKPMKGQVYSGVVAADGLVIAVDHEKDQKDFVLCFRADTGEAVWTYSYENTGENIDYGSCPRATPLIHDGLVFMSGTRGPLIALDLKKGTLVWEKDLVRDFGGSMPGWGYCSSPAIAAGKLIVNPGAPAASVVALDPKTGAQAWSSPGGTSNYGSFLVTKVKGTEQLIVYDQEDVIGRSPSDGKVIWSHPLGHTPGYLVPTPVASTDKLLLCGEDGAHLLALGGKGQLPEAWEAENNEYVIGDATPTVVDNMALAGVSDKGLAALDMAGGGKILWSVGGKEMSGDFTNIIAGRGRALVLDSDGLLHLLAIDRQGAKPLGKMKVCGQTKTAPALTPGRFYVRDDNSLYCYELPGAK